MNMHDERYMNEALTLAARGRGYVEPNPMVGAVVVHGEDVVGRGWHQRFGGPHAEVEALADCRAKGVDPAGCTMYVTLEPCSHHGKTPPCADALIAARLGRVVVAMIDPDDRVSGAGLKRLRDAGITLDVGVGERAAHRLNEPFVKRVTTGLPWVVLKWAQTLDGRIASATGDSQWISGEASRRRVHALRGCVDAVMVGIGTVLADDPQLTARGVEVRRVAQRVVVDPELRLPETAKLAAPLPGGGPVIVAVRAAVAEAGGERVERWQARGVGVVGLPDWGGLPGEPGAEGGRLDLRPLLVHLAERHGATNVLVEGGATLAGALLEQGLVDQVLAFVAPKLMGDASALPAVRGLHRQRIAEATPMELRGVERIEGDVLLDYGVGAWEVSSS